MLHSFSSPFFPAFFFTLLVSTFHCFFWFCMLSQSFFIIWCSLLMKKINITPLLTSESESYLSKGLMDMITCCEGHRRAWHVRVLLFVGPRFLSEACVRAKRRLLLTMIVMLFFMFPAMHIPLRETSMSKNTHPIPGRAASKTPSWWILVEWWSLRRELRTMPERTRGQRMYRPQLWAQFFLRNQNRKWLAWIKNRM